MRQLFRRLRACEAGAGTVEYALLIALIALGLVGILALFGNAVGGATGRTTMSVSKQAAAGYGESLGQGSGSGAIAHGSGTSAPDSVPTLPDSSGASDGTAVASNDHPKP